MPVGIMYSHVRHPIDFDKGEPGKQPGSKLKTQERKRDAASDMSEAIRESGGTSPAIIARLGSGHRGRIAKRPGSMVRLAATCVR